MTLNLITRRLQISPVTRNDLVDIHELHSLPEIDRYNTLGIPEDISETRQILTDWIAKQKTENCKQFTFKIELAQPHAFLGLIGLKLKTEKFKSGEIWYKLHSNFWNKGYATEALSALIKFGFNDLRLHRIEAGCAVENTSSIRVLEKVGMTREGRKRQVLPLISGWSDNFEYAILASDFNQINNESA